MLLGLHLVHDASRVVVNLPTSPLYVEHIVLAKCSVLVEEGRDGPLQVPDVLGSDRIAYRLAAVEGVLLCDCPVEGASAVAVLELEPEGLGVAQVIAERQEEAAAGVGGKVDGCVGDAEIRSDMVLVLSRVFWRKNKYKLSTGSRPNKLCFLETIP